MPAVSGRTPGFALEMLLILVLISAIASVNVIGVIWGGRVQGGTTLVKAGFLAVLALLPLVVMLSGSPGIESANYSSTVSPKERTAAAQFAAALLAVIGYSVNDTVIVYDRVREHEHKYPATGLKDHINNAINETLSRTILTSGTTLFVSVAMFIFGGPAIRDFFLAMTMGVIVGTYSSIFVAAPAVLFFDGLKKSPAGQKVSA